MKEKQRKDYEWDINFIKLKYFKMKNNRFPEKDELFENTNLYDWCNEQRDEYKKGTLDIQKVMQLKTLNFRFDICVEEVEEEMDYLYAVIAMGNKSINPQRLKICKFNLTENSFKDEMNFNIRLLDYMRFINSYGRKPRATYGESNHEIALGKWFASMVADIRYMDYEKIITLIKLDISNNDKHEEKIALLREFRELFGRAPKLNEVYKFRRLGSMTTYIRSIFKNNGLFDKHILDQYIELEVIEESMFNEYKDRYYKRLIDSFIYKYGFKPQYSGIIFRGYDIYEIYKQYEELYKKKVVKKDDSKFDKVLKLVKEFFIIYHRLPKSKERFKGVNIGAWLSRQRSAYRNLTLRRGRFIKLKNALPNFMAEK